MNEAWQSGNTLSLLENGDEFFPRIIEVINQARYEILLETFILADDPVGREIKEALIAAAERGVWISVVADGYGSYYLPQAFIRELEAAGIHFFIYDPPPKWVRVRLNLFRRMHRKLLAVDGQTAFVGGINIAYNHTSAWGPNFKQDYAAEVQGPVVRSIRRFLQEAVQAYSPHPLAFVTLPQDKSTDALLGNVDICFVTRDNKANPTAIEQHFLRKIRTAKEYIRIANPYFFPGYRLLRELRNAARRGVKVQLLMQGMLGSPLARQASQTLYDFLAESGIEVYEYWERQLHGKIAAIDDDWSTIGSSNLDPLSLSLNLEANLFVRDREFSTLLKERIRALIQESQVRLINHSWIPRRTLIKWWVICLVYHLFRHFPGLADWLPPSESPGKVARRLLPRGQNPNQRG